MNFRRSVPNFVVSASLATVSTMLCAQGIATGSVSGTVVDSTGAVLPGATVTATDNAKGTIQTTKAGTNGGFSFPALPVGQYRISVEQAGFSTLTLPSISISANTDRALGPEMLQIGNSQVSVEVNATSSLLETAQSQVSTSFDTEALQSLPLNNGFDSVALLEPGVVATHDLNFSNTNGANFSSNGTRGRSNNFELDGQSNNDNSIAGPQVFFGNQDAIAEIEVIQSNFSAQYGRNEGAVVNYITKSGTNAFHGSAFDFYEGNFMASYPNQYKTSVFGYCAPGENPTDGCTVVSRLPRVVDNRYGGTLGGPILHDKLFFFGSTYWQHTRNGAVPYNSGTSGLTPTPTGLQQLAAAFPNNPGVLVLENYGPYAVPLGNPQPVSNLATTTAVTGPNGTTVNVQVAPVRRTVASTFADQEHLGRLDYSPTSKDRFFLRYFYQKYLSLNNPYYAAGGDLYDVPDTLHSVGADYTRTFSAKWLNQVRYSFQQAKLDFQGGSYPTCTVNTLTTCPGRLNFTGTDLSFGQATNLPQGRTVKVTQIQDNVIFTKGNNSLLFGGEIDLQNSPNTFLPLYNGAAVFSTLSNLVQQNGVFELANGNPVLPFRETDYALYVQDNWKVRPGLTVNLGLRWEFFGQAVNLLHDRTVARESNTTTAFFNTALPVSQRSTAYVQPAYKNFEPRIGFAYSPPTMPRTVVRGGYSIGFDPAFYNIFLNIAESAPVSIAGAFACNGTCLGAGNFSGLGLRQTNLSHLATGGNPGDFDQEQVPTNFHNPYLETYSLGVQQQFGARVVAQVRYVGSHGVGNFQNVDGNPNLAAVKANFPNFVTPALCTTAGSPGIGRPNCANSNVSLVANSAFQIYNSLQTQITMQRFHGFTGTVNYTHSNEVDNSSEIFSTFGGGSTVSTPQNPLDPNVGERGPSGFSFPNVVSVGLTYEVPVFHRANGLVSRVVNGFRVNAVYLYNSGQPYTPYQPNLDLYGLTPSYCDSAFNESTVGSGVDSCRLVLANKKAPLQSVALLQGTNYVDLGTGASTSPSAVHWIINNQTYANSVGNPFPGSGRNILRGQTYNNLDASIFKDTKISERLELELQMNAYNALNRQYRGTPLANAFYDTGVSNSAANPFLSNAYNNSGQRLVQFAAKVKF